eukprot:scaffold58829_cov30-Tisochrysis_lutea.AAC.4
MLILAPACRIGKYRPRLVNELEFALRLGLRRLAHVLVRVPAQRLAVVRLTYLVSARGARDTKRGIVVSVRAEDALQQPKEPGEPAGRA